MEGQSSLHIQGKSDIKIFIEGWGLVILPCSGQIWKFKILSGGGGQSSLHMQAKSEI